MRMAIDEAGHDEFAIQVNQLRRSPGQFAHGLGAADLLEFTVLTATAAAVEPAASSVTILPLK
jgi:hypothetical protein